MWLKVKKHDLPLFSPWEAVLLRLVDPDLELEHRTRHELVSGTPMQRVELSLMDGNLWQLKDLNEDEPSVGILAHMMSGLQNSTESEESAPSTAGHAAQKVRDRLVLGKSLTGFIPGILEKETIAWRQRGQGIEPGGLGAEVDVLLVEHR